MIHIEELELVDFQTHKKTVLRFSPYFNVIVGSTRSGKSSVVRALDFLLYNNWYEDYQRFDASKAVLTAKLSNNKIVKREKGTKVNRITIYQTDNPKAPPQRFEAFGTTLPSEVTSALGVIPIDIGIKEPIYANVANQDDPLFLLYSSGTDRTKVLSRLSGLHWLDYALKDLNADRRTRSGEIQLLEEANSKLVEKLKTFRNLESFKDSVTLEKDRLVHIKRVSTLLNSSRVLISRTSQWKKNYQEMQSLKTIDFPTEISRLEKVISIQSSIIQPLLDLGRKISTNEQSIANTKIHLRTLANSQTELEKQIAIEASKIPVCETCGQELREKV
jgi:exonuclease SbcC